MFSRVGKETYLCGDMPGVPAANELASAGVALPPATTAQSRGTKALARLA